MPIPTPESKLLAAVLHCALSDALGSDPENRTSARKWLLSQVEEERPEALSFSWVCQGLGISAQGIQRSVREILDSPRASMPTRMGRIFLSVVCPQDEDFDFQTVGMVDIEKIAQAYE